MEKKMTQEKEENYKSSSGPKWPLEIQHLQGVVWRVFMA